MTSTQEDPRIDDLRQRLRSLGYLDAGVDRFVLGPTFRTQRPALLAALSSLRVGALAAVLLGPAAAIGLAARLPTLVTGARDALVVAVYLGLLFGLGAACASFIAGLLVARASRAAIARHGQVLVRAAGVLVGFLCLLYLTLWWRAVLSDVGWSSPVWTVSALATAVAISLLLGHAVMTMAAAIVVTKRAEAPAGHAGDQIPPHVSWRTILTAAAVGFGGAALLLTWAVRPVGDTPGPLPLTVVPTGIRLRVVAIDGFDDRVFEELSRAGLVPSLTAVFEGANARLENRDANTLEPADPARIWTTLATGQPPDVHGVEGLETRRVVGMLGSLPSRQASPLLRALGGTTDLIRLTQPAIASGTERKAKTFWEVGAQAGLHTVVVNWWATWPAPVDAGIVLSDRAVLRLEHGGTLDAELSPPALYDDLLRQWTGLKARAQSLAAGALATNTPNVHGIDQTLQAVLRRSAELDALQIVLLSAVSSNVTDLAVVYLPGLDIAQHTLLNQRADGEGAPPSAIAARLEAIRHYYLALDRLLAKTLAPGRDEIVALITTRGRVSGGGQGRVSLRGAGIAAATLQGASVDVAPTILHALGLPLARDLRGSPMLDVFNREFAGRYPVRSVETYGAAAAKAKRGRGQPLDQEMIDRLRSLGYVR